MRIKNFICSVLLFASAPVLAQEAAHLSGERLYGEVAEYLKLRVDAADLSDDEQIKRDERLRKEQRGLAARHAKTLAAQSDLRGADLFYLGLLYNTAGDDAATLRTFKRFLTEAGGGETAQVARSLVAQMAAAKNQIDEAVAARTAYLAGQPQIVANRFETDAAIADAFRRAKRDDEAVTYARTAFALAAQNSGDYPERRGAALMLSATILTDIYLARKNIDFAARAMRVLRRASLNLPSADLHKYAVNRLALMKRPFNPAADETAADNHFPANSNQIFAPELGAAWWLDGETATLESLRGRVVLLDFWATWCVPCQITFPKLRRWHTDYEADGLTIIGVTRIYGAVGGRKAKTTADELNLLRDFKREKKLPYRFAVGATDENRARYGASAIPSAVLIDRRGRIRFIASGAGEESLRQLEEMLKILLAETNS